MLVMPFQLQIMFNVYNADAHVSMLCECIIYIYGLKDPCWEHLHEEMKRRNLVEMVIFRISTLFEGFGVQALEGWMWIV